MRARARVCVSELPTSLANFALPLSSFAVSLRPDAASRTVSMNDISSLYVLGLSATTCRQRHTHTHVDTGGSKHELLSLYSTLWLPKHAHCCTFPHQRYTECTEARRRRVCERVCVCVCVCVCLTMTATVARLFCGSLLPAVLDVSCSIHTHTYTHSWAHSAIIPWQGSLLQGWYAALPCWH